MVRILRTYAVHVAECLAAKGHKHTQVAGQRHLLYLRLVDGGDAMVEQTERLRLQIASEGVAVQLHIVQFTILYKLLHAPAVVGDLRADAAELVVRHLQHTRQTIYLTDIDMRYLHTRLIADVVVDGCPRVL